MRVVLNNDKCTGHGRCYVLAAELFGDDDLGHGFVLGDGSIGPEQVAVARKAVEGCPEGAISITD